MSKKKLFIIITKSNFGGAQRYVFDLASSLSKEVYDITVISGGEGPLQEKLKKGGINTISFPSLQRDVHLLSELKVFVSLVHLFNTHKPDIVHLNSSKVGGVGALAGRLTGVKNIVFTAHGWAFNENRSWVTQGLIKFLYWITLLLSDTTIAVSEKTKQQVAHFPAVSGKITTIYNGIGSVDLLSKKEAREQLAHLYPTLNDKKEILWIGTVSELHEIKGLNYVIKAIKKVTKETTQPFVFLVMGEGEGRKKLETYIKKERFEDTVFLLGYLNSASHYLKAFDVLTLTSLSEALPYSILEAGSAQVPMVASTVGGITEIITDKENGLLVEPKDVPAIAQALTSLIEDEALRVALGEAFKEKVVNNFTLQKMIQETESVYTR